MTKNQWQSETPSASASRKRGGSAGGAAFIGNLEFNKRKAERERRDESQALALYGVRLRYSDIRNGLRLVW
jgi:hypothetical protein